MPSQLVSSRAAVAALVAAVALGSVVPPPLDAGPGSGVISRVDSAGLDLWVHALAYAAVAAGLSLVRGVDPGAGGVHRDRSAGRRRGEDGRGVGSRRNEGRPTLAARVAAVGGPVVVAVALAAGLGLALELVQSALPWRTFEATDLAANLVGAAVGAVAAGLWLARSRRRDRVPGRG